MDSSSKKDNSIDELLVEIEATFDKIKEKYLSATEKIKTILDTLQKEYTPSNIKKTIDYMNERNLIERDLIKTIYFKLLIMESKNVEVYKIDNDEKDKIYKVVIKKEDKETTYFT